MARRVFVVPDHIAATAAPVQWTSQRQQWTDDKTLSTTVPKFVVSRFYREIEHLNENLHLYRLPTNYKR